MLQINKSFILIEQLTLKTLKSLKLWLSGGKITEAFINACTILTSFSVPIFFLQTLVIYPVKI